MAFVKVDAVHIAGQCVVTQKSPYKVCQPKVLTKFPKKDNIFTSASFKSNTSSAPRWLREIARSSRPSVTVNSDTMRFPQLTRFDSFWGNQKKENGVEHDHHQ
jgi:hypothetical protein